MDKKNKDIKKENVKYRKEWKIYIYFDSIVDDESETLIIANKMLKFFEKLPKPLKHKFTIGHVVKKIK